MNILIKTKSFIEMLEDNNYKKINIKVYQRFIEKLIYLSCGTKLNIAFAIEQFSK